MPHSSVEKFALTVTKGVGSPTSIIIHTLLFIGSFFAAVMGFIEWPTMLLVLTTIVSLEAIYLSIFIQMSINYTTRELEDIGEDVEEMQEDIGEIQEDVDELQEDVEEISEDVEDISEDVEEMTEEEKEDDARKAEQKKTLADIQADLHRLMEDITKLQNK
jgi:septal ring factor EnvC (AmiA/AmiB activator)